MTEPKICENCKEKFERDKYIDDWHWNIKKYCSYKCAQQFNQRKYNQKKNGFTN